MEDSFIKRLDCIPLIPVLHQQHHVSAPSLSSMVTRESFGTVATPLMSLLHIAHSLRCASSYCMEISPANHSYRYLKIKCNHIFLLNVLNSKDEMIVHEKVKDFYKGFNLNAHPMSIMCGVVGALSSFYEYD
jgi:hypothetical protein